MNSFTTRIVTALTFCTLLPSVVFAEENDTSLFEDGYEFISDNFGSNGSSSSGRSGLFSTPSGESSPYAYSSGPQDRRHSSISAEAFVNTNLELTCDGVSFSSLYGDKIKQYPEILEQFVKDIPSLAIIYVAYTQPLLKGAIDEANASLDALIGLTGTSCNNLANNIKEKSETSPQALAQDECIGDEGSFSMKCFQQEQSEMVSMYRDQKSEWKDKAENFFKKINPINSETSDDNAVNLKTTDSTSCYELAGNNITEMLLSAGGYDCIKFEKTEDLIAKITIQDNVSQDDIFEISPSSESVQGYFNTSAAFYATQLDIVLSAPWEDKRLQQSSKKDEAESAYEKIVTKLGRTLAVQHISTISRAFAKHGSKTNSDDTNSLLTGEEIKSLFSAKNSMPRYWALEEVKKEIPEIIASLSKGMATLKTDDMSMSNKLPKHIFRISNALSQELRSLENQVESMRLSLTAINELVKPIR